MFYKTRASPLTDRKPTVTSQITPRYSGSPKFDNRDWKRGIPSGPSKVNLK